MTEIWLKQCPICLVDFVRLKDFRFFSCGHRWCSSCLKKHKGNPLCGECRQPKGKPHRIYLDLEDLVDDQIALVADGLNAIDNESSPSAIENFNRAVQKLCEKPNTDPAVTRALLEAVEEFTERVAPLAEQGSELKSLNNALNRQLEDMQSQLTISRDKLKKARMSVQVEKEESKRLRFAVDRERRAKEEEMAEKKEMQAQLDEKDSKIKLLKNKLRALSKKQKINSIRDVEDSDSSFEVVSKTERRMDEPGARLPALIVPVLSRSFVSNIARFSWFHFS